MEHSVLSSTALCAVIVSCAAFPWAARAAPPVSGAEATQPIAPAVPASHAQSISSPKTQNALTEVVTVTARRRAENIQATPVAITALSAKTLDRNQVTDVAQLAHLVPNIIITRQGETANQANIFIRGFGSGSDDPSIDPPIALFVDGIYQPSGSGDNLDLFGIQQLEVDRGPQGTLLGKNAPTGAINVTSLRPTNRFEGQVEAGYESFDHVDLKGRFNLPLIKDVLSMNASVVYKNGGNYITDLTNGRKLGGEQVLSSRVGLLFTPTSNFEWLIQFNGENTHNQQAGIRDLAYLGRNGSFQGPVDSCIIFGHCDVTQLQTTRNGFVSRDFENDRQVSSRMTLRLAPITLTSITGYKTLTENNRSDVDGEPEPIIDALQNPESFDQFSEEARISSAKNGGADLDGRLDWVIGGYYSHYRYDTQQLLDIFGTNLASDQRGTTDSKAVFAHAVYDITDKWNVSAGLRESWDSKAHNYRNVGDPTLRIDAPISFANFSFEAGSQYKFTPGKMIYFRFAEGYRSGGYQGLPAGNIQLPYRPETVKTYEIGTKDDFFEHRLRTNLTLFWSNYSDLQETIITALPPPVGFGQVIQNAAGATVRGVEFEATAVVTPPFTITTSVGYLDAQYNNFIAAIIPGVITNNDGFPFPYAPKWSIRIAPQYVLDLGDLGTLTLGADVTHSSSYQTDAIPFPSTAVKQLTLLGASVTYDDPSSRYAVTVYGHNITNQHYLVVGVNTPTAEGSSSLFSYGVDAKPAVYGFEVSAKF